MTEPRRPQRTCVGCRRTTAAGELQRIAAASDGTLAVGVAAPGRGAWVCSVECFDEAVRRGALGRALRTELPRAEIQALRAKLA